MNETVPDWMIKIGYSKTAIQRFWKKVSKTDNCWNYIGGKDSYGYGSFFKGKKYGGMVISSRFSWMIFNGENPIKNVLHRCDNRACVNPSHLFLGTHKENMQDMVKKGRNASKTHPEKIPRGSNHSMAKLNEKKVIRIRKILQNGKRRQCEVAKDFKVSVMLISLIARRKLWTHI